MSVLAAAALSGCVVVDGGGNPPPATNYEPYISDVLVECFWDASYAAYAWDFVAWVDDADGYTDVRDVYVDVIDMVLSPGEVSETWGLVYDGNGQWSQTVYEDVGVGNPNDYSQVLQCPYSQDYEFDFYAVDSYGAVDSVTYVPL